MTLSGNPEIPNADSGKRRRAFLSAAILVVYSFVLSFSIANEWFGIDDARELSFVRDSPHFWRLLGLDAFHYFRPVKNVLWWLFVQLEGWGVRWCHAFAIVIGVLSFFPVWTLFRRIFGSESKALAAAGVWILSPTLVSSVAWLSGLNIQVMAAFAALAISNHDAAWDGGSFRPWRTVLSGCFLFLALVSYECAVAVLPILFLFDAMLRPGRTKTARAWTAYAFDVLVVVLYLALRSAIASRTDIEGSWADATRLQLAASSPYFTLQHFASWFWPFGRFVVLGDYKWGDVSIGTLAACAFLGVAVVGASFVFRKRQPVLCFCVLFALAGFAPVSNFLGFGNGPYGDYYLTLSSIGIAAGVVEAFFLLLKTSGSWRVPAIAVAAIVAATRVAAAFESAHWAWLWADTERACMAGIRNFPRYVSNKYAVIRVVCNEGRYDEALQLGREIENRVGPDSPVMGNVYLVRAIYALNVRKSAKDALSFLDRCADCHVSNISDELLDFFRGCAFEDLLNREDTATECYERALSGSWDAELVPCADRLARIKAMHGKTDEAVSLWERALELAPENASVLWNLSVAYRETGRNEQSEKLRKRFQELTKKDSSMPAGMGL